MHSDTVHSDTMTTPNPDSSTASGTGASASTGSATKRALLTIKSLQAKLEAMERAHHEPIAIVGMSCRFPGGAETPEAFWHLLDQGTDGIGEVPGDRWSIDQYYDADPDAPGKMVSRYGGFVPHLYDFDASFFRIAPKEALSLDPQQRLLLELGWEGLEHGGIAADTLSGQSVGVFVGLSSIDHWQQALAQHPDTINAYLATGNTHSVAAGRLSFLLGLTGPSMAVDAACASSLVAVHLACQSLRQQDCDMALAGGVNRIITPESSINFSKAHMLSADGRCRTFDQHASGFGRAEGGGMVVLKRLSDAEAAGDRIHALILGSAVNHDGRTSGLTVPNGPAQTAVIRKALKASRIDPSAVHYIETHGTGTALGDPIEVGALTEVFNSSLEGNQTTQNPLVLGAVKTNIGHLEAAAGMAGLIKATLTLQHDHIPANLHLSTPNALIDWDAASFLLPTTPIPWHTIEQPDAPRIAGISSFGFNGTNAHVIISTPTPSTPSPSSPHPAPPPPCILPLSAKTALALKQLVARYIRHCSGHPDQALVDLCFTASVGRSHFSHRLAVVASSLSELRQVLVDVLAGRNNPAAWHNVNEPSQTNMPPLASNPGQAGSNLAQAGIEIDEPNQADLHALAQRYVQGEAIDWPSEYREGMLGQILPHVPQKVVLPFYPFQRQYYGPEQ